MKKFRATGNLPTRPYQQHAENLGFRSCSAIVHSSLEHILFRETILSPRTSWSFESSWSKLNEWWRKIWFYWPANIVSYLYARDWSSRDDWLIRQCFCWVSEVSNKIKLNTKNRSRVLLNYLINWEKKCVIYVIYVKFKNKSNHHHLFRHFFDLSECKNRKRKIRKRGIM